jgi:hypothetical protein
VYADAAAIDRFGRIELSSDVFANRDDEDGAVTAVCVITSHTLEFFIVWRQIWAQCVVTNMQCC